MKIYTYVSLKYDQCDTISLVLNLDQAEQNSLWLNVFQLNNKLTVATNQKFCCKNDDSPQPIHAYPWNEFSNNDIIMFLKKLMELFTNCEI